MTLYERTTTRDAWQVIIDSAKRAITETEYLDKVFGSVGARTLSVRNKLLDVIDLAQEGLTYAEEAIRKALPAQPKYWRFDADGAITELKGEEALDAIHQDFLYKDEEEEEYPEDKIEDWKTEEELHPFRYPPSSMA